VTLRIRKGTCTPVSTARVLPRSVPARMSDTGGSAEREAAPGAESAGAGADAAEAAPAAQAQADSGTPPGGLQQPTTSAGGGVAQPIHVRCSLRLPPNQTSNPVTAREWIHHRRRRALPQQGGLGASRCVHSVCGSACIARCIRSARAAAHRAPGPDRLLGPGRCGCARFWASENGPECGHAGASASQASCVGRGQSGACCTVWNMMYTPALAISPCASCARPGMQANCSKQKQQQPILGCFAPQRVPM